ncbi:MAG: ParB/RepB/Spo0J family partition protein [Rhodospirillum sp.]|nr:ParB/RepB/Spo0J family partition protein [Rhodospirillum sp.]MCF8491627.1 ParB/RepB/Spo0J family partition protein [Rhodospirillum sp.]MCF8500132.1 ParB/RepB/Spo0J family partition protein [Rhodospirillum sp.]
MSNESSASNGRRRGLGRGLSALLGDDLDTPTNEGEEAGRGLLIVPIGDLVPNPNQPRKAFDEEAISELADSIRSQGILTPILVRPDPTMPGSYQIIAGERRWRAGQRARLHEVPVLVRDLSDKETLEVALVENLQRQDLNPLEEAEGYRRLQEEFSHSQEDLGRVVGKSRSHVANTMRLLQLPLDVRDLVSKGLLTAGHARALLTTENASVLAQEVVTKGLNVRQTEKLAKSKAEGDNAEQPKARKSRSVPLKDPDTLALERDISNSLGLTVTIEAKGRGGSLIIEYETLAQLDDVLHRLSQGHIGQETSLLDDEAEGLDDLVSLDALDSDDS